MRLETRPLEWQVRQASIHSIVEGMDSHDAAGALKVERQESCGVIVPASSLAAKRNEPLQEPEPSLWSRVLNYFYPSVNPKPAKERPLRIVCVGVHGWAVFGGRLRLSTSLSSPILHCMAGWWFSDPHSISHNIAERLGHAASSFMSGQDFGDVQLDLIALSGHGLVMQRFELYMNEQLPTHEQAFRDADVVGKMLLYNNNLKYIFVVIFFIVRCYSAVTVKALW